MNEKVQYLTILVVDDEEDILDILQEDLRDEGVNVLLASSAADAVVALKKESVDVVLSDLHMDKGSGWDLLSYIHGLSEPSHRPLVYFMSGFATLSEEEIHQHGVCAVYQKPMDIEEFVTDIQERFQKKAS